MTTITYPTPAFQFEDSLIGKTAIARIANPSALAKPRPARVLDHTLVSRQLGRGVRLTIILPPYYRLNVLSRYPLALFNDGQDFGALDLERRVSAGYADRSLAPRIIVGIHADGDRMRDYGTSNQADYLGRGDRADEHRRFVTTELLPWLRREFRVSRRRQDIAIAGFSLGGLSAFDIAWQHAHTFGAVASFSGSFWWRSAEFDPSSPDADRIMVDRVRGAEAVPNLRYYFAAGDAEEASDRNGNGVIDAVDDTQDVVDALLDHGVDRRALRFDLVAGGRHDQQSWGPQVITWLRWLGERGVR